MNINYNIINEYNKKNLNHIINEKLLSIIIYMNTELETINEPK